MSKLSNKDRLAALRGALPSKQENSNFISNYYPFFAMDIDEKAVVRFLPDLALDDNPRQFLYEKLTHKLLINGQKKNVPCLKNYGEADCPICAASVAAYKRDGDDSVEGKALYRKKEHLAQVLVIEDPLKYKDDETPAKGEVKLVNISWSVFDRIMAAFEDDDLDDIPYDYETGTDFIIKKTKKGKWANYDNSKFTKNSRALTEKELEAIEGKLVDLSTLLPKKPTLELLTQMLDAHQNGTVVSESSTAPTVSNTPQANASVVKKASVDNESNVPAFSAEELSDEDDVPSSTPDSGGNDSFSVDAEDILASIRARRAG